MARKRKQGSKTSSATMPVMRPDAAGIDIGAMEIFVAVPADRATENVRSFPTFTQDLYSLADWLHACGIRTVAMESTGVYWIPLFQILEARDFEVCLVNARHVKNVPGRRTDVCDCQWLQFLHSVGLLKASYRPAQEVCAIRSLLRHRESLVQMAATHVNHMQKALDQMNVQLHHVISDIVGQTGLAIVDAILAGQRDPLELAKLRGERIKATEAVIAKSLVGDYRHEHLFTLKQSLEAYRTYQKMIDDCDREIRLQLEDLQPPTTPATHVDDSDDSSKKKQSAQGILRAELQRVWSVDLTRIPGIRTGIAQTLLGEIGPDFTKFRSASAFASWMGLCPDNDISGGKVLFVATRKVKCRAALALRMAAQSLHHSKSALGDFYRRMRAKLGAPKAITAAAHKLARIIFHLISTRQEFDDSKFAADQVQYQKRQEAKLHAKAKSMGYALIHSRSRGEFLRRSGSSSSWRPLLFTLSPQQRLLAPQSARSCTNALRLSHVARLRMGVDYRSSLTRRSYSALHRAAVYFAGGVNSVAGATLHVVQVFLVRNVEDVSVQPPCSFEHDVVHPILTATEQLGCSPSARREWAICA